MIGLQDLLNSVNTYCPGNELMIKRAYDYAAKLHEGQFRQSGEPYIIHPLSVAFILSKLHVDIDTICAGLLHDVVEDTPATIEDIARDFNQDIADLVEGVTKLAKMNFSSKQEQNNANTRKIITSLIKDLRIIIIKLADRLHNMRTIQFKSELKQKENALETLGIFAPLANYIGIKNIKDELEDLSLKCLKPDTFKEIEEKRDKIEMDSKSSLEEMAEKIRNTLVAYGITCDTDLKVKNIFGIYKKLIKGRRMSEIHNLLALKVIVPEIKDCYLALYPIHDVYHPFDELFKDYICNPKTNMYQALHTNVFEKNTGLVQIQIKTPEMDQIADFGLTAYWNTQKENAREIMQETLRNKFQFFKSLVEIDEMFSDNQEFVKRIKDELFTDSVYAYTLKGEVIELPEGSTVIDFAYRISNDVGNKMVGAYVNDEFVPLNYVLKNKDRVRIITDDLTYGPKPAWESSARTSYARERIRKSYSKVV